MLVELGNLRLCCHWKWERLSSLEILHKVETFFCFLTLTQLFLSEVKISARETCMFTSN